MNVMSQAIGLMLDRRQGRVSFNTGESGEADLKDFIFKFQIAAPLREASEFAKFKLDEWPTLTWDCGFDIDPEYLYEITTGK